MNAAAAMQPLPALREDLRIAEAATEADGAPAWVIEDPVINRFYRIGWLEFECLVRWGAPPAQIVAQIAEATPLHPEPEQVLALAEFLDQEARPHRVAHRCHSRPADELGNDGDRVFQLTPRPQREHVGVLGDSRGLQARDHQRGITVARYHQHRQPLQRHRLVAGEVRQIAAHGHQQGIHAGPLHAGPSALDAIEEDG